MERIIRRIPPEDLEAYTEIYLNAYPSGKSMSKQCFDMYYQRNRQAMQEYGKVNFFGLYQDDVLIAAMKLIDFDTNLFGKMSKATGLMSLAVHPLFKKKGAGRAMVRYFEEYTVRSGAVLCMLLPFNIEYYRELGYGYGTKLDEYRIPTLQLPACRDTSKLRLIKETELDQVLACHCGFVRQNHGAVEKLEEETRDLFLDDKVRRIGYFEGAELKGYAAFDFVGESDVNYTENRMEVSELIYSDGQVLKTLLGGLRLQADLAQNVVIRTGEADFHCLLDSPQDISGNYIDFGFLQTNISAMGTMYKIPDVKLFIDRTSDRRFPLDDLKIAFSVGDGSSASREERFSLKIHPVGTASWSSWSYQRDAEDADVEISIDPADLSSLLMGSVDLAPLLRLGVVSLDREYDIDRLDRVFHYGQRPFTNTDY